MPAHPTPAQSAASRLNGARSHGPVSVEGKARIAEAATRHGLFGRFRLLPEEDAQAFAQLLAGWCLRLRPVGPAELAAVERLVIAIWREQRLAGLEVQLLRALCEGAPTDGLPSLATLIRYKARLERDRRTAEAELEQLRALARNLARQECAEAEAVDGAGAPDGPAAEGEATARPAEPAPVGAADSRNWPGFGASPAGAPARRPQDPLGLAALAEVVGLERELAAILSGVRDALAPPGAARPRPDGGEALGRSLRAGTAPVALATAGAQ